MIVCVMELIPLVKESRVKDKIHLLLDEPGNMAMRQLCGIAFRLAGDRFDAELIDLPVGNGREHDAVAQLREEGKPKRVVLVHVQHSWNPDSAPACLVGRQWFIGKVAFQLIVKEVRHAIFLLARPRPLSQRLPEIY